MYICCAELFLGHEAQQTSETFRGLLSSFTADFKELVTRVIQRSERDDVVIVSDGRSEEIRKTIRGIFTVILGVDDVRELWVIYNLETSMRQDVRNPKRKLAWSGNNIETLFVKLPFKAKG